MFAIARFTLVRFEIQISGRQSIATKSFDPGRVEPDQSSVTEALGPSCKYMPIPKG